MSYHKSNLDGQVMAINESCGLFSGLEVWPREATVSKIATGSEFLPGFGIGFADDVAKTNLAALLQQHGIAKVRSL